MAPCFPETTKEAESQRWCDYDKEAERRDFLRASREHLKENCMVSVEEVWLTVSGQGGGSLRIQ